MGKQNYFRSVTVEFIEKGIRYTVIYFVNSAAAARRVMKLEHPKAFITRIKEEINFI